MLNTDAPYDQLMNTTSKILATTLKKFFNIFLYASKFFLRLAQNFETRLHSRVDHKKHLNILIITQKVDENDDILGFMHGWLKEFAKHAGRLTVICLEKGEYHLPENVRVLSLGKEKGVSKLGYLINFYKYIWQERANYSYVFVHMNQIYVTLGGLVWRALGKKIGLWYAHGHIPFNLRLAEMFSHFIFTSTKSGFRLKSKKVHVVGQGIDVGRFNGDRKEDGIFEMIIVGRISPVKDLESLIKAVEIFAETTSEFHLSIIGSAGTEEQKKYLTNLKREVKKKNLDNKISFKGSVPNKDIAMYLNKADLFVSTSNTGSLDKAILEAMASSLPVLTCNVALIDVLGPYKEKLIFNSGDYRKLAKKIEWISKLGKDEKESLSNGLRGIVKRNHSLENFVKKIINIYLSR